MTNTIIILNYCDAERTYSLAKNIESYQCIDHIVIVDNASPDGSFKKLQEMLLFNESNGAADLEKADKKIAIIQSPENWGYAKGNHYGISYAYRHFSPDLILIANPDVSFSEKTVSAVSDALSKNPGFGVIAPLVRRGRNAWRLPGYIGVLESLFLFWFNLDKAMIRCAILRDKRALIPIGVVEGSFFGISMKAYKDIHGFDRSTFLYGEEIMLSYRLHSKGYKIGILKDFYYDHLHSASIKKEYGSSKARAFTNMEASFRIFLTKYLHASKLKMRLFDLCCRLAFFERLAYDKAMGILVQLR
ncbi:MAG: glycosyltransferase family 2 protein [Lachnospiraceae bacterium]|nr:glycosyltransferase family 2 protein [Lachnospiraceae bacterium]